MNKEIKVKRNCPICMNKTGIVLYKQNFELIEGHYLPNNYNIVSCTNCGFVYADSIAKQDDYDKFYKEMSKYEDKSTASGGGIKLMIKKG